MSARALIVIGAQRVTRLVSRHVGCLLRLDRQPPLPSAALRLQLGRKAAGMIKFCRDSQHALFRFVMGHRFAKRPSLPGAVTPVPYIVAGDLRKAGRYHLYVPPYALAGHRFAERAGLLHILTPELDII
jgi:hypothetical protein